MSEITPARRRRADAERSAAAILESASTLLAQRPDASVEQIAEAAGVSRQTVYAHFPSRQALRAAVAESLTRTTLAAIDAAGLDEGPAADALVRLLDASWETFARYPVLLTADAEPATGAESDDLHAPVRDRLARLIRRGQRSGEFDRDLAIDWLIAATISLGHAAGAEVGSGRMTVTDAMAATRQSVLRVYGTRDPRYEADVTR